MKRKEKSGLSAGFQTIYDEFNPQGMFYKCAFRDCVHK